MGSDIVAKDFQHSNIFDLFQVGFGQKIDFWFQTCIVSYFELMWNFFFWIQIDILNGIFQIWFGPPWTDKLSVFDGQSLTELVAAAPVRKFKLSLI